VAKINKSHHLILIKEKGKESRGGGGQKGKGNLLNAAITHTNVRARTTFINPSSVLFIINFSINYFF